jgi:hypothetical protein
MLDIWKWRFPSFPQDCWKSFPGGPAGHGASLENGDFQMSKAISMDMMLGWAFGHRRHPPLRLN